MPAGFQVTHRLLGLCLGQGLDDALQAGLEAGHDLASSAGY
jgi:hypothetical protein